MAERISTGLRNSVLGTGSWKAALANGILCLYSGTQPASADDIETGTLLCKITLASGAFTGGSSTNGINYGTAADGVIDKAVAETWSGACLAAAGAGTVIGWYRFYANAYTSGASTSAVRMDGAVSTAGAELNLGSTTAVSGRTITIDSLPITQPAS